MAAIMTPLEQANIYSDKAPRIQANTPAIRLLEEEGDDDEREEEEDESLEEDEGSYDSAEYDQSEDDEDTAGLEQRESDSEDEEEKRCKRISSSLVWNKEAVPPLLAARCGHVSVSTFNDTIVTAGGYAGGAAYLSSAELYVPGAASWQELPNMLEHRSGAAACLSPYNEVVVAGGSPDGSLAHRSVERFDLRTGKWEFLAPMTRPRSYTAGCLGRDGLFYVTGGIKNARYEFDDTIDVYDFRANKWTLVSVGSVESDLSVIEAKKLQEENIKAAYTSHNAFLARASHHMFSLPAQPVTVLHDRV